jgi:hypothetical protein
MAADELKPDTFMYKSENCDRPFVHTKRKLESILLPSKKKAKTENRKRLSDTQKNLLLRLQHFQCNACRKLLVDGWDWDHIVPLRNGGTNQMKNYQALCLPCHRDKSVRETQMYFAVQREIKCGHSKYFDPQSPWCNLDTWKSIYIERESNVPYARQKDG